LDNVERYVLNLLGVTPILLAVKVSAVGFEDVLDSALKGLDKCSAISAKFHGFDGFLTANCGKSFQ
jgi:hypothetical protein